MKVHLIWQARICLQFVLFSGFSNCVTFTKYTSVTFVALFFSFISCYNINTIGDNMKKIKNTLFIIVALFYKCCMYSYNI